MKLYLILYRTKGYEKWFPMRVFETREFAENCVRINLDDNFEYVIKEMEVEL